MFVTTSVVVIATLSSPYKYGIICFLVKYRLMKNPQKALKILLTIGEEYGSSGFIKTLSSKLIQKLEHSWHSKGLLIYGNFAT